MQKIVLILSMPVFFSLVARTQPFPVEGRVVDDSGHPLIGASVLEKGKTNGAVTDLDGYFSLVVSDSLAVLLISYTGFADREFQLDGSREPLSISLAGAVSVLDEVVVTGLGGRLSRMAYSSAVVESKSGRRSRKETAPAAFDETRIAFADAAPVGSPGTAGEGTGTAAGTLTAGEINDFGKWELWQDIAAEDLGEWKDHWQVFPSRRYTVQVTSTDGKPVVNAPVLAKQRDGSLIWKTRTDNTGKAELWAGLFSPEEKRPKVPMLSVEYGGVEFPLQEARSFHEGLNQLTLPVNCELPSVMDIAFVVDATGSMQDEINYLKTELQDVIRRAKDTLPGVDLRLGSVFYRDRQDEYLTRLSPLSTDIDRTLRFIGEQNADGGNDYPEAVEEALRVALRDLSWREEASGRLLFLVLDAPPHRTPEVLAQLQDLLREAAARGIRIIPLGCSGIDKSTEYLMRAMALATNGTYTFLTDHSGVGNPHIEPTTDAYDVEKLNALLARIIFHFGYMPPCEEMLPQAPLPPDTTLVALAPDPGLSPGEGNPSKPETVQQPAPLQMRFYPNPTSGPLTVEVMGAIGALFLADFTGKILERFTIADSRIEVDLAGYPSGTYYLRFLAENNGEAAGKVLLVRR